jgi:hypothetical protein
VEFATAEEIVSKEKNTSSASEEFLDADQFKPISSAGGNDEFCLLEIFYPRSWQTD